MYNMDGLVANIEGIGKRSSKSQIACPETIFLLVMNIRFQVNNIIHDISIIEKSS